MVRSHSLHLLLNLGLTENVTLEKRPEGNEVSHMTI